MAWTLTINGKNYTMNDEADYEYRSHIGSWTANYPNNWVACHGKDENGDEVTAWYNVENPEETDFDEIDYNSPDDIEDGYGHIIYDSEE